MNSTIRWYYSLLVVMLFGPGTYAFMWSIESMACEKRLSWFSEPLPTESYLQQVTRQGCSGGLAAGCGSWFVVRGSWYRGCRGGNGNGSGTSACGRPALVTDLQ